MDCSELMPVEREYPSVKREALHLSGERRSRKHFAIIYILGGVSILLARLLTKRIYEPLTKLDEAVKDLTDRIEASPKLELPQSNIALIDSLTQSFKDLAEKIINYTRELRNKAYYDPLTQLPTEFC